MAGLFGVVTVSMERIVLPVGLRRDVAATAAARRGRLGGVIEQPSSTANRLALFGRLGDSIMVALRDRGLVIIGDLN